MNYVISDIHGEFEKFIQMLKIINFKSDDNLYILGDIADRGMNPIDIYLFVMQNKNIHFLIGNHEEFLIEYFRTKHPSVEDNWMRNGGYTTLKQLENLNYQIRNNIIEFIINSPSFIILNNFILVHAGINITNKLKDCNVDKILQEQTLRDLLWIREDFYLNPAIPDKTIIFGHTPTKLIRLDTNEEYISPLAIWYDQKYKDKLCIDCGAVFNEGRLACLRLEDMKEYYI